MKAFFKDIFEYHDAINFKFFPIFNENSGSIPGVSLKLMCHILSAHHIWNARILSLQPQHPVWDMFDVSLFPGIQKDNYEKTLQIISERDFEEKLNYTNTKGETYRNSIREILFHVNNHTTHHRAQIASQLKLAGIQPPVSDYIFYKR